MALYCYIVETGYYEDKEANILGHKEKYTQDEFDDICIKITEKYGNVEEVEYFSNYDKCDVEEIKYKIDANDLIKYLVAEYGFIELDVPVNDGYNSKEISRKPVPPENLRKVVVKSVTCPFEDKLISCTYPDSDYDVMHFNARCNPKLIRK